MGRGREPGTCTEPFRAHLALDHERERAAREDRRRQRRGGLGTSLPGSEAELDDVDPAELREFLSADLLDVQADPVFKERLRRKLWRLVRLRYGDGPDDD